MNIRSERPRRARFALVGLAAVAVSLLAVPHSAGAEYPPKPSTRSITVAAAGVVCNGAIPSISYEISTDGFETSTPAGLRSASAAAAGLTATITILDSAGNIASGPFPGQPLVGQVLYPGAAVDADGKGIDYPGWDLVDGLWVPDPDETHLRSGLSVEAVVESSTAVGPVRYPAGSEACLSPAGESSPPQGVVGVTGALPTTGGSDPTQIVWIAVAALLAGGVILAVSHRRHGAAGAES